MQGRAVNFVRPPGWNQWVDRYRGLLQENGEGEAGNVIVQAGVPYVLADRQGPLMHYDLLAAQALVLWVAQLRFNLRDGIAGIASFPVLPHL